MPWLDTLTRLELRLQEPAVRSSRAQLEALLHPDFEEVGRSGRRYTRESLIRHLADTPPTHEPPGGRVESFDFAAWPLGDAAALLTYASQHRGVDGRVTRRTRRASLWLPAAAGAWCLRYHQGTPLPDEAEATTALAGAPAPASLTDLASTVERLQSRLARHPAPAVQTAYCHYVSLLPRFAQDLGAAPRDQLLAAASALMLVQAQANEANGVDKTAAEPY